MRTFSIVLAFAVMGLLTGTSAALADPLSDIVRDLMEEGADEGDHVVGEELCVRPPQTGS